MSCEDRECAERLGKRIDDLMMALVIIWIIISPVYIVAYKLILFQSLAWTPGLPYYVMAFAVLGVSWGLWTGAYEMLCRFLLRAAAPTIGKLAKKCGLC